MEESSIEPFFASRDIAIVGLGLMGGSLAMALHGHCHSLLGVEVDPVSLSIARDLNLFDCLSNKAEEVLPKANCIILATPVQSILDFIAQIPGICPQSALIMDLGSTKQAITLAMQSLPARFEAIGGHPMCGKEKLSLANADPALYRGANFAFIHVKNTTDNILRFAQSLCQLLEANPLWVDAETHDRWCAATSHLPFLISSALTQATQMEASPLIGPGFISTSRLASTPASMMLDVLSTNQEAVLDSLSNFQQQLAVIQALLSAKDFEHLEEYLDTAYQKRTMLTHDFLERVKP